MRRESVSSTCNVGGKNVSVEYVLLISPQDRKEKKRVDSSLRGLDRRRGKILSRKMIGLNSIVPAKD